MNIFKLWKTNSNAFTYILIILLVSTIFSSTSIYFIVQFEEEINSFNNWQWGIIFIVLSLPMAFGLMPTTLASIICGYFLGWTSLIGLVASYIIACAIGHFITSFLDKGRFIHSLEDIPNFNQYFKNIEDRQLSIIIICRISPILPFAIMNVLLTFLKVEFRKFILGSIIGMLPRTLLCVLVGTQLIQLKLLLNPSNNFQVLNISFVVLLIISAFGFYSLINKIFKKTIS